MRTLCFVVALFWSASSPRAESPLTAGRDAELGQHLARQVRSALPEETEVRGLLKIRPPKSRVTNNIPVISRVLVHDDFWDVIYETGHAPTAPAERLVVRHFTDAPNQYFHARAAAPGQDLPQLQPMSREQTEAALAGSDFSLADLGLDFLHWPVQRRLKGEMRLGRACDVLESSRPDGEIQRVKSWIDKESGGILIAEAYDADGKLVKEFSLSGSSFKKVNGRWHLEKMEIRNVKTGSRTVMQFDLPRKTP